MDPLLDPDMAEWLRQKQEGLGKAYEADKAEQANADRRALLMQFAQGYASGRPSPVQPRHVNDARQRFGDELGLEREGFARMPKPVPVDPLLDVKRRKMEAETANLLGGGATDALEPELVERAKRVGVPTDKRKREPVIADILAAERAAQAAREARTKADADAKGGAAKTVADLRKEFQGLPIYKDTVQVAQAASKIQGTSPNGPGDISMIFAFMKMVDPGSTVREGEFATAQNAGSVPQSIIARYNAAVRGAKLSPEVRAEFRSEARNLLKAQLSRYERTAAEYRRIAKGAGLDPSSVVLDLGYGGGEATSSAGAKRPRRTDPKTGETREWDGSSWVPVGG